MAPTPPDSGSKSSSLRFGAGLSGHLDPAIAAEQACEQALTQLGDRADAVDLAFLFIADRHGASAQPIAERVRRGLGLGGGAGCLIGVTACGVAGGEAELEDTPGVSILAASLPGVQIRPFRTDWLPAVNVGSDSELAALAQAAGMVGGEGGHRATFLFADPFSVPMGALLSSLSKAARLRGSAAGQGAVAAPILGGMASLGRRPDTNVFILNDELSINGGVGVSLSGAIDVAAVVSQGCRPIGTPLVVTACRKQLLHGLAGRPALEVLAEIVSSLNEHERELLRTRGLFLGRAVNEYKERFGRGDFLIRNVIGIDKRAALNAFGGDDVEGEEGVSSGGARGGGKGVGGAIAVAELLRIGQTVQFHVRDEQTADEDLALLLDGQKLYDPPAGALLFTCNGRGRELFGEPHHDARAIARAFSPTAGSMPSEARAPSLPLAGFFAAGEIGPIGDDVFVHGQTACIALFRELR